ncbi:MAG: nucleotide exchange factor GrpE [Chloroflexota bacterium]|nr:nucleotide exchange factor GrpE [Chloroflexota bacterium]
MDKEEEGKQQTMSEDQERVEPSLDDSQEPGVVDGEVIDVSEPEVVEVTASDVLDDVEQGASWQDLLESAEQEPEESSDPVVGLVNEYKEAVKARDEWEDKYLRAAAEYANAKRRSEIRAENEIWASRERVLTNILPVLDDFERAFAALPEEVRESSWADGFGLIQRKLQGVLEREGVTRIEAEGQPFDPNLHQAVMMVDDADNESDTVLEVLQQGYMLGDRVLRPTMVKVAQ